MLLSDLIHAENVDLTNCDREAIHIPGSIQPHGILLVLSEPELEIVQVSDNSARLLGKRPEDLLKTPLSDLIGRAGIEAILSGLAGDFENINPLVLSIKDGESTKYFNGIIHRSPQDKIILELEPCQDAPKTSEAGFFSFHRMTQKTLRNINQVTNLQELCDLIVKETRNLTQFDRVMVYRFDRDGSGVVIAEDKAEEIEPYLGLRYPESDIPKQARVLYRLNPLRLIPDVDYAGASLLSANASEDPLDLSFSVLRSVSPIHIEYLKNMGVQASMSISLVKEGKLWGLIACHHRTARFVPYEIRTVCEFLGQIMSGELAAKENNENLDYKLHLQSIQSRFVDTITRAMDFGEALLDHRQDLLDLVGAEGVAVCLEGQLSTRGKTPPKGDIQELMSWLTDKFKNHLYATDSLPLEFPEAEKYKDVASGLLALSITRIQKNYILWFRPEILKQVSWAGNPHKPKRLEEDGTLTIFPRQSFETWQATVRLHAEPWQPWEIEGAIELRSAIVGIILRKADELAAINQDLEKANSELDAFTYIASHDLKEPLRGIHNYSNFLLEDYGSVLDEEGISRLRSLVRLTERMEDLIQALLRFSRLGRYELHLSSINLNRLLQNVLEVFKMSQGETSFELLIPEPLPTVRCDRALLEEVLVNLIANGLKYNDRSERLIEIGMASTPEPENPEKAFWTFYVRDNGIGIREKHLDNIFRLFKRLHGPGKYGGGTGAGLTIVRKIIERHGGTIWVESQYGEGSTFYFTLPA